jgi:hypothetical protein
VLCWCEYCLDDNQLAATQHRHGSARVQWQLIGIVGVGVIDVLMMIWRLADSYC